MLFRVSVRHRLCRPFPWALGVPPSCSLAVSSRPIKDVGKMSANSQRGTSREAGPDKTFMTEGLRPFRLIQHTGRVGELRLSEEILMTRHWPLPERQVAASRNRPNGLASLQTDVA